MFYYQASSLQPNLINASVEEEEGKKIARARVFREVGNVRGREEGVRMGEEREGGSGGAKGKETRKIKEGGSGNEENENKAAIRQFFETKRANMIMEFSSEEQEEKQQQLQTQNNHLFDKNAAKNQFLLAFSDDENSQDEKSHNSLQNHEDRQTRKENRSRTEILPERNNKLILEFDEDSEEEGVQQTGNESTVSRVHATRSLLSNLLQRGKEKYYLLPIDQGEILQCVIKREKNNNGVRYQIYDSATLRNFMTILKSEDGYIFISKYESLCQGSASKKETVVAKLLSNFFGTEFNCFLCELPYRRYGDYDLKEDHSQQIMTIEYQTNLFGLKGPRKMTAFIPKILSKGIASKKRLNEIYESQKKKKLSPTVQRYKNKTPKWNKSIQAYVLNFYGRATVSSIKNFIMIHENQPDDADARVLFGKYGKQLFNLDIRFPFNLVQGLALALSSFDKKLACE